MKQLFHDTLDLLLPRFCCVCGKRLEAPEVYFCKHCADYLPYAKVACRPEGNPLERQFCEFPVDKVHATFFYRPKTPMSQFVLGFKFRHHSEAGTLLGDLMYKDLCEQGVDDFFEGVDMILPVPLTKKRQRERGYNQSELLARALSKHTGIPCETKALQRVLFRRANSSISLAKERYENVKDAFRLAPATKRRFRQPTPSGAETLRGRCIVLVDDVMTTGATLRSVMRCIMQGIAAYEQENHLIRTGRTTRFRILTLSSAHIHACPLRREILPFIPDDEYRSMVLGVLPSDISHGTLPLPDWEYEWHLYYKNKLRARPKD